MIPDISDLLKSPATSAEMSPRGPRFAVVVGVASAVVGFATLVGWALGFGPVQAALSTTVAMKPLSSVALLFLGMSLVAAAITKPPHVPHAARIAMSRVFAAIPVVIGMWMLLDPFSQAGVAPPAGTTDGVMTSEWAMAAIVPSAILACFVLLGSSLLLLDARSPFVRWLGQWPALIASIVAFAAVLGHLYDIEHLAQVRPHASVAFHSAVLVAALGGAILLVRPDRSLVRELISHHLGGLMARRVLPVGLALPVVLGWTCIQAQHAGLVSAEVGLALFTVSNVVLFSGVIWLAGATLNRADADRRGADFERLRSLHEAEARWRALIEASAQIVWTSDVNGVPDDSPSMRAFTGQSLEDWRANTIRPCVHPDDWDRMSTVWRHAVITRTTFTTEFRLRHVSGEWRWLNVRAVPIARTGDSHIAWVGMSRDVTDRKRNQTLTEGQKQVLEQIARGAPLASTLNALARLVEDQCDELYCSILLLDADGTHLRHGAAPSLPTTYTEAIDGVAIGPAVGSCGTAAFTRRPVFVEDIATDSLWEDYRNLALRHGLRACWSTPIVDASGQVLGTLAMYYKQPGLPTATERRLIDLATHTAAICLSRHNQVQALRDSESRFRQLAESLPQLVWTCEPDGDCDYVSRQWLDYTGLPAFTNLAAGLREQLHPADRDATLAALRQAIEHGTELHCEHRFRRHDGVYRWFDTRAVPLRDAEGRIVKWIGSNTDVDDRKRMEEAQLRSQKLESLGTLAGGIAHDFNNMLLVIQGNAQLAQDLLPQGAPEQEHLAEITHASGRAADLVRRILSFSRPQKARHRTIELGAAVEEAIRFARAALPAMVEIRSKIEPGVPAVKADATQIHQVLLNLATNSAHAIGSGGGYIEIELSAVELDGRAAGSAGEPVPRLPAGKYARLTVRDNGCGMTPDVLERVFDPFFTTKPIGQGTGLGLPIVHGILRSSGGAVTVQSEPGKGTAFHLFFPAAREAARAEAASLAPGLPQGAGQHVLFIDDEDAVVRLGTLNLTRLGYRVTGCTDPTAALREFHRNPDHFDVVVTDLSMPGKTGFDCAREMLAARPQLPIVLTSGYLRPEDEAHALEIGIRAVRGKPEALTELGDVLGELLATSPA